MTVNPLVLGCAVPRVGGGASVPLAVGLLLTRPLAAADDVVGLALHVHVTEHLALGTHQVLHTPGHALVVGGARGGVSLGNPLHVTRAPVRETRLTFWPEVEEYMMAFVNCVSFTLYLRPVRL